MLTVIFDLDETLVHCKEDLDPSCDLLLQIQLPDNQELEAAINIRPGA